MIITNKNIKEGKMLGIRVKRLLNISCISLVIITMSMLLINSKSIQAKTSIREVTSYFSGQGVSFTPGVDTPVYVQERRNGLLVESDEGGTLVYNNPVNLNENTKEDLLVELQLTPRTNGSYEMKQIIVRLEDTKNSNNYIDISLYRYPWGPPATGDLIHVSAKTRQMTNFRSIYYTNNYNAQTGKDNITTQLRTGVNLGAIIYGSFNGSGAGYSDSVKLYFDTETRSVYATNSAVTRKGSLTDNGYADEEGRFLVLKLDNPDHIGSIYEYDRWKGWTDGTVNVKIITQELTKADVMAKYMVLAIDGQTFDGTSINDKTPPVLTVDLKGYSESSLPRAQVGKQYPFFDATAKDKMYGNINNITKRVFKDGKEVYFTGNGFIPSVAGEYSIEYSASDGNGNTDIKRLNVVAENLDAIEGQFNKLSFIDGAINLAETTLANENGYWPVALYSPIKLPEMSGSGGSGNVSLRLEVLYNGKSLLLDNNAFTPEHKGLYEISYILTDFIGGKTVYKYTILAEYSDVPVIKIPALPDYILSGYNYCLPAVKSDLYSIWRGPLPTINTIKVLSANKEEEFLSYTGDGNAFFMPDINKGDKVIIRYESKKDAQAQSAVYEKQIKVIKADKLSDRFILENGVTKSDNELSVDLTFESNNAHAKFINPILTTGLLVKMNVPQASSNYDEIIVGFTDEANIKNRITVNISRNPNSTTNSYIAVNGGAKTALPGSFFGTAIDDLQFMLSSSGQVTNSKGEIYLSAMTTVYGEKFNGFQGKVYVDFSIAGKKVGAASIRLLQLGNQVMGDFDEDYISPLIKVHTEPSSEYSRLSKVTISSASAGDVFGVQVTLKVRLSFNDSVVFSQEYASGHYEGSSFIAQAYGTYELLYIAEDESGNPAQRRYTIEIKDRIAPEISVLGEMPAEGKAGERINLPEVSVADNYSKTPKLYGFVMTPMGECYMLKELSSFTAGGKGTYAVRYYAEDDNYNFVFSEWYLIDVV